MNTMTKLMTAPPADRAYYWTKTWGAPTPWSTESGAPAEQALVFSTEGARESALRNLRRGDIVVYVTSHAAEADPMMRGRIAGAVEIEGHRVTAAELGIDQDPNPNCFKDGKFRWPYGISIQRAFRVDPARERILNDDLIPDHKAKGITGGTHVHAMTADAVERLKTVVMQSQAADGSVSEGMFAQVLRGRPWSHRVGEQTRTITPGAGLYIATLYANGRLIGKWGKGKIDDRLNALNAFRIPGEVQWSIAPEFRHEFEAVEQAEAAESHIRVTLQAAGWEMVDRPEMFVIRDNRTLKSVFAEAIETARQHSDHGR